MNDNRFNEFDEFDEFDNEKKPVKKQKSKKEKVGFYVAFAICLVAVGLAVFSTYTGITNYLVSDAQGNSKASDNATLPANNTVTGVVEDESEQQKESEVQSEETSETGARSIIISEIPSTAATDPPETETTEDALQTMLSVSDSLSPPLKDFVVQKEYSETAVYNKTLNDWRAHAAMDLKAKTGDEVCSMVDGVVDNVQSNDLLGNVISVKTDDYVVNYCGLSKDLKVEKGQQVKRGDIIGTVGVVPFEAMDDTHLHLEIKVKGKYIDPLTVIKNNE